MIQSFLRRVSAFVPVLLVVSLPVMADDEPSLDMIFPQDGEVTEYTDSWGAARSGGRSHEGADLMAPKMTPVYAVADGEVTTMDTHGLAGNYLDISHEGGWMSRYLHLNNDNPGTDDGSASEDLTYADGVEIGAHVKQGDVVAWVGDSGNAEGSGSHLHFELHIDGVPVNPYPYLVEAQTEEVEAEARELATRADRTADLLISELLPVEEEEESAGIGVDPGVAGVTTE